MELEFLLNPAEDNLRYFSKSLGTRNLESVEKDAIVRAAGDGAKRSVLVRLMDTGDLQVENLTVTTLPFREIFERRIVIAADSCEINLLALEDLMLMRSGSAASKAETLERPG